MKSLLIHYKNKYPACQIRETDSSFDVYDVDGGHRVALRKTGAGQLVCQSEALGCIDRHDLSPIPKDARLWKMKDGCVAKDEKHDERLPKMKEFLKDGKVLSCEELMASGYKFDDKQVVIESPK